MPARVTATAMPKASDMPDEDLIRAEQVPVRAARRRPGDPFAISGSHKVAQHAVSVSLSPTGILRKFAALTPKASSAWQTS